MAKVLTPEHKAAMLAGRLRAKERARAGKELDEEPEVVRIPLRVLTGDRVHIHRDHKPVLRYEGKLGTVVGLNRAASEAAVRIDGSSRHLWFAPHEYTKA